MFIVPWKKEVQLLVFRSSLLRIGKMIVFQLVWVTANNKDLFFYYSNLSIGFFWWLRGLFYVCLLRFFKMLEDRMAKLRLCDAHSTFFQAIKDIISKRPNLFNKEWDFDASCPIMVGDCLCSISNVTHFLVTILSTLRSHGCNKSFQIFTLSLAVCMFFKI